MNVCVHVTVCVWLVREEWCQCLNRPDLDECMCACDSVCVVSEGEVVSVSQQT